MMAGAGKSMQIKCEVYESGFREGMREGVYGDQPGHSV